MTNILVTIGPKSFDRKSILSFSKDTKLFRLNGSHSDLKWHQNAISLNNRRQTYGYRHINIMKWHNA